MQNKYLYAHMLCDVTKTCCQYFKMTETVCRANLHLLTSYFAIATENLPVIDCNISPAHEIKVTLLCT